MYYEDNNNCGFYLLIDIINEILNIIKTPNEIKKILVEEYGKYLIKYSNQIIDILILEGKKIQGLKVKQDILSFQDFIYSNDYFITNLDIWIILNKYKIPSIIIATKPIILTNKKQNVITLYTNKNKNDKYVIILSPALRIDNIPKYSIIISKPSNTMVHSLNDINNNNEITESIKNNISIEKFLQLFIKTKPKLVLRNKNKKNIDEDENVGEHVIENVVENIPNVFENIENVENIVENIIKKTETPPPQETRKYKSTIMIKKKKTKKNKIKKIEEEPKEPEMIAPVVIKEPEPDPEPEPEPDPEPKEPEPEEPVIEEERIKISEQKPITKRCKNGTRRNKKTGNCDPI